MGHFDSTVQNFAKQINYLEKIISVSVGWGHSVALSENGTVFKWGAKPETYQLEGSGKQTEYYSGITQIKELNNIKEVACGSWHSLAIDGNGEVWSWGWNAYGMLGNETTNHSDSPVKMNEIDNAYSIGAGCFQSIIVDSSGNIYSCGDNNFGQLGLGDHTRQTSPKPMTFGSNSSNEKPNSILFIFLIITISTFLILFLFNFRKVRKKF